MSDRDQALQSWVAAALGVASVTLAPASADASFRRYFRVATETGSAIVMDAPPPQEDCRPFVRVATLLRAAGVHAPEVLAQDLERGFLLLTDLGKQTYLEVLNAENADDLLGDAMDALCRWQSASRPDVLPAYDRALLRRELDLFPEWYVARHLGVTFSQHEQEILDNSFRLLEDSALAQARVFVHRDYMPRNLMFSNPNPGVLDFQDAVYGPLTYDVVSLFRDAFLSWDEACVTAWCLQYRELAKRAGLPVQDAPEFIRALDWMGLQRHLKVLGIFARINYRDGKPQYLADTPRFLNYVCSIGARYPEFTPLLRLLDRLAHKAGAAAVRT
ncbi:MAG TPA: phosphotransferase [Gammaproteobacteria bacterium]|nr:phosphotransferase [Gammaproteobacteria bacterium]